MLRIFKEADKKQGTITSLCKRYGISRKWFYKWKKRRAKEGDEGLRSKIRKAPKVPNKVPEEIEKQILNFVKEYPAYGLVFPQDRGWFMKNRITPDLIIEALNMAIKQRKPGRGLLLHLRPGQSICQLLLPGIT